MVAVKRFMCSGVPMVAVKNLYVLRSACGRCKEVVCAPECLLSLSRGFMGSELPVVAVKSIYGPF